VPPLNPSTPQFRQDHWPKSLKFPIWEKPVVSIDLDDTLCENIGYHHYDVFGNPRKGAIWALKCFKHNNYDVVIFTNRPDASAIREKWCDVFAPGLVDYINGHPENARRGFPSPKPVADIFIDDRDWQSYGDGIDWHHVMLTLLRKGLLPQGLLPEDLMENE
jgi:hypothetical protein